MDEEILVEELDQKGFTRRDLLKRTAGVGVGLSALGMFEVQSASGAAELTKVKWISPRGTLDVMDDFNRHVAADPRTVQVLLTVRDGVTLIRHA